MNFKDWVSRIFSAASYPFPPGTQNRDGFERNHDVMYRDRYGDEAVLRLSAAWSCVRLLAETVAAMPLTVYERKGKGAAAEVPDFWLYSIVHDEANRYTTAQTFWETWMVHLLLRGKAFARKIKASGSGRVIGFELLNPDSVGPGKSREFFRVAGEDVSRDDLVFTIGLSRDGINGMSPIEYGALVFGSALNADTAARNTFRNGLMPTVAFTMKEVLQKKQREEFRENFKSELGGALNAGKPPLLEGGMTASPLGINPKDAQLLESRGFSIEEICRWYRVPPFMIGHTAQGATNWGTGIEQQTLGFIKFSLMPWMVRIEKSIAMCALSVEERSRYFLRFNVEGLLRGDSQSRAQYLAQMTQNGLMTRNEGRAYDNREPMEGGDVLTVQSNLIPLPDLGADATVAQSQEAADVLKRFLGLTTEVKE